MNIDQAMFLRQEKIRRFPQSRLAKMDRFMKCPINRKLVYGLQKRKHWSEFASNLLSFFEKTGFLTTKQELQRKRRRKMLKQLLYFTLSVILFAELFLAYIILA